MQFVILIFVVQAMYSLGDLLRKLVLNRSPFDLTLFRSLPFILTFVLSTAAFVLQLYVLKNFELSKTIVLLGTMAVILSTVLGVVFLKEKLNLVNYLGVVFAVLAVILINIKTPAR